MDRRLLLPLLALCLAPVQCEKLVPVVGWSNSDVAFSSIHGNEFANANDLLFRASLDKVEMVIIFDAPELSFDSLAKYGGMYGDKDSGLDTIQSEIEVSRSSIWAGAKGDVATDLVSTLSYLLETQPLLIKDARDFSSHKLVRIELPASSEEDGFSLQDDVISEIMNAVNSLSDSPSYAALYTSNATPSTRPLYTTRQHGELRRKRSAGSNGVTSTESDDDDAKCYSVLDTNSTDPCLAFCFSSTQIFRSLNNHSSESVKTGLTDLEFLAGSCSNDSDLCSNFGDACISVSAKANDSDTTDLEEIVNFIFSFQNGYCSDRKGGSSRSLNCGFWTMDLYVSDVYVKEEKYGRNREEKRIFTSSDIPVGTSYACGDNLLNIYNTTSDNGTTRESNMTAFAYYFTGIQVQAFSKIPLSKDGLRVTPSFSSVYNCQSYVSTVPIMGFIAVLVLGTVLYCSIAFIFGIQSPDRFDDPRGPTISVENLH